MVLRCHLGQERQRTPIHEGPRITLYGAGSHVVIPGPGLPFPAFYSVPILGLYPVSSGVPARIIRLIFYSRNFLFMLCIFMYIIILDHSFKPKLSELTRAVPCTVR